MEIKARLSRYDDQPQQLLGLAKHAQAAALNNVKQELLQRRQILATKISKIKRSAKQIGLTQGRAIAASSLRTKIEQLDRLYPKIIAQAHTDCLNVALAVAEEVIGQKMTAPEKDSLLVRIERALSLLTSSTVSKIEVAVSDHRVISNLSSSATIAHSHQLVPSAAIFPGDAQIHTDAGTIKLQWQEHLNKVKQKLRVKLGDNLARVNNDIA